MVVLQLGLLVAGLILFLPAIQAFATRFQTSEEDKLASLEKAKLDLQEEKKRQEKGALNNTVDFLFGEGASSKTFTKGPDLSFLDPKGNLSRSSTGLLNKNNSTANVTPLGGVRLTKDVVSEGITIPVGNIITDDGKIIGQSPTFSINDSEKAIINARRNPTSTRSNVRN